MEGVSDFGSIPALERMMQFAGARHRLITNNIANLSTPGFRPADVSVDAFQDSLREAVEERAREHRSGGPLRPADTNEVAFTDDGLQLTPSSLGENILFHDGNDRNVERIMQDLVENFFVFRQTSDLLRNRFALLNTAIRERV